MHVVAHIRETNDERVQGVIQCNLEMHVFEIKSGNKMGKWRDGRGK